MTEPQRQDQQSMSQMIEADALALGRKVLGRDLFADEAEAMKTIFSAAAQALTEGFIRRLADHVLAERREESIEGFFEGHVRTD